MPGTVNVNIGGKERPIYFGTNQSRHYCELRGITLAEMTREVEAITDVKDEKGNITIESKATGGEIIDLVYSALWAGAKYEGQEVDFDNVKVGFWLDEVDAPTFFETFYRHWFNLTDDGEKEVKKKESEK